MKHVMLLTLVLCLSGQIFAQHFKSEVFTTKSGAINGYDPVAFFRNSKPVMGADSLSYSWKGATWFFANRSNLQSFKEKPEKYAPQYGGYCAYGTSQGHKAPTEVGTWTILDDKLYFNYNEKVKRLWVKDQSGYIQKADQQWPEIEDKE